MFGRPSSSRRWSTRGPPIASTPPRYVAGGQNGSFRRGVCPQLAEIYLLKLEAAVRAAKEAAATASTSRFVPVTLPAAEAS
jgi:hypothetical protein